MKPVCWKCGEPVDPTRTGTYREVTGWEKVRKGGGANAIILREETGKLMCSGCGESMKLAARWKVVDGQESLL